MKHIKRWSRMSFKTQMIIAMSVLIFFLLTIMGATNYYISYNSVLGVSAAYNQELVKQLCRNIELYSDDIYRKVNSISYNPDIRYYGNYFNTIENADNREKIRNIIFNTILEQNDIDDINLIYSGQNTVSMFGKYRIESIMPVCDFYKVNDIYIKPKLVPLIVTNINGVPSLPVIKSVFLPNEQRENKYFIVANIRFDKINQMMREINLGKGSGAFLVGSSGEIANSEMLLNDVEKKLMLQMQGDNFSVASSKMLSGINQKYLVSVNPLSNSNISVIVYNPDENLTATFKVVKSTSFLIVFFGILLAIAILISMLSILTRPIAELAAHMAHAGGNLNPVKMENVALEINILYDKFNQMINQIKELMNDIKEKSEQKRKAELKALQFQINPHFLYNTLDSINAMAILRGATDIMAMITSLARLLRLSISTGGEFVRLEDEIEHAKYYLNIQKIRYVDKFITKIDVDRNIMDTKVVRLILQPLIENAIYHGVEPSNLKCTITIRAFLDVENIVIEVEDDGLGIPFGRLEGIQRCLQDNIVINDSNSSIGIYNVNSRLKLYFGSKAGLYLRSIEGEGTTSTIILPAKMEGNDYV